MLPEQSDITRWNMASVKNQQFSPLTHSHIIECNNQKRTAVLHTPDPFVANTIIAYSIEQYSPCQGGETNEQDKEVKIH